MATPPKLVLAVIDGLKPAMLDRAIATGRAPALKAIVERGTYVDECCAAFPSVTPVCAASIATGERQDRHRIPSMNWYHREEQRYVEYGSSFSASRRFGIARQLTDTVFNMNAEPLPADVPTVFESLDDAGVRTAGTTYVMPGGGRAPRLPRERPPPRLASTVVRRSVMGPKELFYADIFASRETGCRSQLGLPGIRDQHAGCVATYLVENDLFDFLLLSLPDNDTHSHRNGPHAQVASIANADRQLERMFHAGGGADAFLAEHAVIVVADHSHAPVERRIELGSAFDEFHLLPPSGAGRDDAEIALCPAQRSAMGYALLPEGRDALVPRLADAAAALEGVDLVMWRPAPREGAIRGAAGELRFAPGGDVRDARGGRWSVDGPLEVLDAELRDGAVRTTSYPDALARVWAALTCDTSGDVLLSAAPGWEFPDWGGVDHIGGGSHGSLHRSDSLGALAFCGVAPPDPDRLRRWSIADVAPMIRAHFGTARVLSHDAPPSRAARRRLGGARRPAAPSGRGARAGADRAGCEAGIDVHGDDADRPERAGPGARHERGAGGPPAHRHAGPANCRAQPRVPRGARKAPGVVPERLHEGPRPLAGEPVQRRQEAQGARAALRRRPDRRGDGGVDGLPGRVDDGARVLGRLRAQGQLAMGLDPAHPAVRRPVRRLAAPAADAAPRPRRARRVRCVGRVLQRRADRDLGPAGLPAPRLPARPRPVDRAPQRSPAAGAQAQRAGPHPGDRARVPRRLPDHPQRPRLERHRRRLRGRHRGRPDRRRPDPLRQLPQGQRTRRHVRAGQLRRVRAVRAGDALERALGRPPRRARRVRLLRPRVPAARVPRRPAGARAGPRDHGRVRVGVIPVDAVRDEL